MADGNALERLLLINYENLKTQMEWGVAPEKLGITPSV